MIINGELQTGLGGGVCQVSTTVFNAAYEAGLPITARTNHALYISHYPLGRDATVDYPDIDLKFVNDTGHWLLLRTFVGSSSLVATLYGTPQHRRVVSETSPLTGRRRRRSRASSTRRSRPGTRVVDDYGEPARPTRYSASSTRPTGSCCRTRLVLELPLDAEDRRLRPEAEAQAEAEAACDDHADHHRRRRRRPGVRALQ